MGLTAASATKEEAYKLTLDFMEKLDHKERNLGFATFYQISHKFRNVVIDGICHVNFVSDHGPYYYVASQLFETPENSVTRKKFWSWLISDKSPWISLTRFIEPTFNKKSGLQTGWLLDMDKAKDVPFLFIKNFAILTRVFTEKHPCFRFWELAVDSGVDPRDAFVLCTYFCVSDTDNIEYFPMRDSSAWGGHWPIQHLDLNKFLNNSPDYSETVNGCWSVISGKYFDFNKLENLGESRKTKFSKVKTVQLNTILNKYYELKRECMK